MTPPMPLPDATLEAMLARRAARARPIGLQDEIGAAIARTPQRRRPPIARPGWGTPFGASLRPILVVAVVGLVLAALVGLALVGTRLLEHPAPLLLERPEPLLTYTSKLDTMTGAIDWWSARTDVDGNVWAYSPGHLARLDATTGTIRAWSLSDDDAFASSGIAPARDGGVWVIGKSTLRRFDRSAFRTVIDAPRLAEGGEIWALAEAPDGDLWAALGALGVRRWDGAAWTTVGEDQGVRFATFVTVDEAGRVWAGGEGGGVSAYDGTRWMTYPGSSTTPASVFVRFIAVAPDGMAWVGTDAGLARLDGTTWTDLTADIRAATGASPAGSGVVSIAFGADGAVWVAYVSDLESGTMAVHVARFDGRAWTAYGPLDGLPTGSYAAWLTTTSMGVFVATSPGLFTLDGDLWRRVWPTSTAPSPVRQLLAVSRDEAWAAGDDGIFRYEGGTWVYDDPTEPGSGGSASWLARAPDGTIWSAGNFGVAVRDGGRWAVLDGPEFGGPIAVGQDGTPWVVESHYPADMLKIDVLSHTGGGWSPRSVGPSPVGWVSSLAVARDGTVWVGSDGFFADELMGLARFDGRGWERVRPLGTVDVAVHDIEPAPQR